MGGQFGVKKGGQFEAKIHGQLPAESGDLFKRNFHHDQAVAAFKEMVLYKRNPALDEYEVLNLLRNSGLNDTANYLHALM